MGDLFINEIGTKIAQYFPDATLSLEKGGIVRVKTKELQLSFESLEELENWIDDGCWLLEVKNPN